MAEREARPLTNAADEVACQLTWNHWVDWVRPVDRAQTDVWFEPVETWKAAWRAALAYARQSKEDR